MIVNGYTIKPGADLYRANLTGADLTGAVYDDATRWPWVGMPVKKDPAS